MSSVKMIGSIVGFYLLAGLAIAHSMQAEQPLRSQQDIARDKVSKGSQVIDMVDINQGMTVLDVLGGGGYYSELLSEKVGNQGKVYLHNNQAYMPYVEKELTIRLADNRLSNVIRWDKEAENLALNEEQFDAVFFILGYHDLYHKTKDWDIDKDRFLAQLYKALKVGGKLLIVDHSAKHGSGTKYSQQGHRIDVEYVKKELEQKGFKLIRQSNLLANLKDDRLMSPFAKEIRRKTDRFILLFEKK
ncbi:class I SAM-dependent methyltransferase [Colwellia sp. RSH04]|uniref:class I SAM-dependent methyltransferase n=1 Tax=Colwellia sp. RSH04 TaxID=2305464 RepID=UPI000E575DFF|nr:class I SAM-dependent methyltransferase [Colwellia sp. RSH04]RHW76783.1 methyltransferase domain-containing protein [Colwellia sp. RSH04]